MTNDGLHYLITCKFVRLNKQKQQFKEIKNG